ncbi:MAG: RNA methyltransferase [Oscillospiraceae bacterium]|nr:RNA methyltransferase [Oscillospiraceae bacterium]
MERITSRKNPVAAHLKKLGADASYRRETGEFVCDGGKLLSEALLNGADIRTVLLSENAPVPEVPEGTGISAAPRDLLAYVSSFKTPPDVLFSCALPGSEQTAPRGAVLVLENVQDPGNVGTVLRTADAFSVDVVLAGACADPFSPKAARASMGAVFRRRTYQTAPDGLRALLGSRPLYGAALGEKSEDIRNVELAGAAVAVGSEGRGLSETLLSLCDGLVVIPMSPRCESLNAAAAAAVVMWEMAGKRLGKE